MVYKKHESKSSLTGWRHILLQHCSSCAARRYIGPISVYYLPRLRASNVDRFNERKRLHASKKEAEDTPHKQLGTWTTPMTLRFW